MAFRQKSEMKTIGWFREKVAKSGVQYHSFWAKEGLSIPPGNLSLFKNKFKGTVCQKGPKKGKIDDIDLHLVWSPSNPKQMGQVEPASQDEFF